MKVAMVCSPIAHIFHNNLYPSLMDGRKVSPHLGPYLLASIIRKCGYPVQIIDLVCNSVINKKNTGKFQPFDIILFSCNSTNWPTCLHLITWIKQRFPEKKIILGGIHATLFNEYLIRNFPIDYILSGEGEKSLPLLIRSLSKNQPIDTIPGICVYRNNTLIKNPPPQLLTTTELDALPSPLFEQMPDNQYLGLPIESSRGCIGNCTFCAIPFHKRWRPLSPESFVDSVEYAQPYIKKVRLQYLNIIDDCFTIDSKRVFKIIKLIEKRGIDFQATYDARIQDFSDRYLVETLAPFSKEILIGAESFSDENIQKIGKKFSEKEIITCAKNVSNCGIADKTTFSFIIGFPWETKTQINKDLKKITNLILDYNVRVYLQWHTLTPGSQLWESCYREKKVDISDLDKPEYLTTKKWFNISTNLSGKESKEISDIVLSLKNLISFYLSEREMTQKIVFTLPPYMYKKD